MTKGITKKISATAMSEVDVTYISLVKRGANRQPIKIHKSEDGNKDMSQKTLDLAALGARAIKSEATPVLVAAIVKKGEGERIAKLFADVDGLEVHAIKTDDTNDCDVINFTEDLAEAGNTIVYKHDDDIALVIGGQKETTQKMDFWANSTSFKENIQKTSFFPNLHEAGYTLVNTIANILHEGEDAEAVKKTEEEISAFGEYVNAMVQALPVTVTKSLEGIDFKAPVAKEEEAATTEAAKSEEATTEEAAKSEEEATTEAAKSEEEVATEAAKSEEVATEEAPDTQALILEQLTGLAKKFENVESRLDTMEADGKKLAEKTEVIADESTKAKSLAEKADAALAEARGTVVADPIAEDEVPSEVNYSQEDDETLRDSGIELA